MEIKPNNIYNMDCYEAIKLIPDKSIDLIVTDPPYLLDTSGSKKNNISVTFRNCNNALKTLNEGIDIAILDEYMRVMKKPNIYIWCNKKQIPDYLDYFVRQHDCKFEILCWCKTNPTPLCGGNYLIDKEFCLYFRDGIKLNTTFETASTFWVTAKNVTDKEKFSHPTCKPLYIIEKLIINSSNANDIVLDTFIGSGTTAVACKNTGRQYIGFEIEKKWYDIAQNRLNNIQANGQETFLTM